MSFITWVEKTTESVSQNTIGKENTDMWLREERKLSCGNKTSQIVKEGSFGSTG